MAYKTHGVNARDRQVVSKLTLVYNKKLMKYAFQETFVFR